jgi:hypothetical protein
MKPRCEYGPGGENERAGRCRSPRSSNELLTMRRAGIVAVTPAAEASMTTPLRSLSHGTAATAIEVHPNCACRCAPIGRRGLLTTVAHNRTDAFAEAAAVA